MHSLMPSVALYRSVVAVGPVSASEPPTSTLEFALGIPSTPLELLLVLGRALEVEGNVCTLHAGVGVW
jgi:hypothetical protein